MTIDLAQIKDNSMVRYGFKILLMREFDIHINETDVGRLIKAAGCIEIYDFLVSKVELIPINSNMRCIEISPT